jgi:Peptidase family S41
VKLILFLILLVIFTSVQGQQAQENDLDFITGKITKDYAGYADKISPKGLENLITKLRHSTVTDTLSWLSRLTNYFKDDHLAVFEAFHVTRADSIESESNLRLISDTLQASHGLAPIDGASGAQRSSAQRSGAQRSGARTSDTRTSDDGLAEGYWLDDLGNSIIYLRCINARRWEGDIIETKARVPAGLHVLRLTKDPQDLQDPQDPQSQWQADYIDAAFGYRVVTTAWLKQPGVLMGRSYFKFRKCDRYTPGMLAAIKPFSYDPSVDRPDSETLVIRMPYFEGSYAKLYDSLVKVNSATLNRISTLILDIRNNPGGTIRCYLPLAPYICTGPLHSVGGYQRVSSDVVEGARKKLQYYVGQKDSANAARYRDYFDSLEKFRDSFLPDPGEERPCQPGMSSIRHVAILTNHGSRSAAELMVLDFRQSAKVTLFGENTGGAVDYLDELTFWLPGFHYEFWVASSKRQLTPKDPAYDSTGIPPDVAIPESESDWIGFVKKYYRTKVMQ